MKICIQGADFETNNMGVSALAAASIQAALHSDPNAEVFILSYERLPKTYTIRLSGRKVSVPLVNIRFSWKFWLRNNIARLIVEALVVRLIPFKELRQSVVRQNPSLQQVEEADVVAAVSGGDSFSDIYGLPRLVYVSLPQILALLMRKRLMLLPQTLGPFKSSVARAIAKYIMNHADVVYSRDYMGVKLANEMLGLKPEARNETVVNPELPLRKKARAERDGSASLMSLSQSYPKVRFCHDVAFVLEAIIPEKVEVEGLQNETVEREAHSGSRRLVALRGRAGGQDQRPLVGLNVSGLLFSDGHQWSRSFGLRTEYRGFIFTLIEYLLNEKESDVLLVPHVFGTTEESDPPACQAAYDGFRQRYQQRIGILRGRYDQNEIKSIIGQCDFFIGSRMHACIAAVSQCVPAVSIAYSDKFIGVMNTVGVGALVADPRSMSDEEILRIVGRGFNNRRAIRAELEDRMLQIKEGPLGLFAGIGRDSDFEGAGNSDRAALSDAIAR